MKLNAETAQLLYKVIADEVTMAIVVVGPDNIIHYANRMAHYLFEFSLDESTGFTAPPPVSVEKFFATAASEKRIKCLNAEVLEMQGLIQDVLIQKPDSNSFIATLGIRHVTIDGARHLLLMIQDVTFQKKLQREITEKQGAIQRAHQDLLHQNQQLKELDIAKDRFVAMTTHELRTPVSAILASADILKSNLYDDKTQHDEFVNIVFEQAQHLLDLVNDILDFSKIRANKMDYYIEEKDLSETVAHEFESMKQIAKNAKIELILTPPAKPMLCYFDEVRIKQVVTNLISNAIKYNVPNGQVRVEIKSTAEYCEVYIQDTGKGIAEADFGKIFSEFETLGKMGNHSKGTGLGLPISQRMVRRMGGEILLTSEIGKGSVFWFTVPRQRILDEVDYRSRSSSTDDIAS